jgi:acetyltransferase-like isoleucine patch superfamily enzyme
MNWNELYKRVNLQAGPDCVISPFCSLENVVLGNGVRIADGAQLKNVIVGDHTKISRNVTFYSAIPDRPVRLGNHCWFSVGVFGEATGGEIRVGDYAVVAHGTILLTSSGPGEQSPLLNQIYPVQLGAVIVSAHSWVGAHCVLLPGTELAEGTVIAANSLVPGGQYGSWSVYGGNPARRLKPIDPAAVRAAKANWPGPR